MAPSPAPAVPSARRMRYILDPPPPHRHPTILGWLLVWCPLLPDDAFVLLRCKQRLCRTSAVRLQAIDRRERLRRLALETIDLTKDPYFMRNHLGQYECRLCLTLHNNEGNYLAHTQVRLWAHPSRASQWPPSAKVEPKNGSHLPGSSAVSDQCQITAPCSAGRILNSIDVIHEWPGHRNGGRVQAANLLASGGSLMQAAPQFRAGKAASAEPGEARRTGGPGQADSTRAAAASSA